MGSGNVIFCLVLLSARVTRPSLCITYVLGSYVELHTLRLAVAPLPRNELNTESYSRIIEGLFGA